MAIPQPKAQVSVWSFSDAMIALGFFIPEESVMRSSFILCFVCILISGKVLGQVNQLTVSEPEELTVAIRSGNQAGSIIIAQAARLASWHGRAPVSRAARQKTLRCGSQASRSWTHSDLLNTVPRPGPGLGLGRLGPSAPPSWRTLGDERGRHPV